MGALGKASSELVVFSFKGFTELVCILDALFLLTESCFFGFRFRNTFAFSFACSESVEKYDYSSSSVEPDEIDFCEEMSVNSLRSFSVNLFSSYKLSSLITWFVSFIIS